MRNAWGNAHRKLFAAFFAVSFHSENARRYHQCYQRVQGENCGWDKRCCGGEWGDNKASRCGKKGRCKGERSLSVNGISWRSDGGLRRALWRPWVRKHKRPWAAASLRNGGVGKRGNYRAELPNSLPGDSKKSYPYGRYNVLHWWQVCGGYKGKRLYR